MLEDQTIDAAPASGVAKRTNAVPRERASASTVIINAAHEGRAVGATVADSRSMTALLPIMGVVLVAFLVIGLALPVLPLHVHQGLGLTTFVVGPSPEVSSQHPSCPEFGLAATPTAKAPNAPWSLAC